MRTGKLKSSKTKETRKAFGTLTRQQRLCLLSSIKPIDVKYANREQVVGYLYLLEKKLLAIRECTRLGKDFDGLKLSFSTEFVYKALSDLFITMTDYLKVKDMVLYREYSTEASKTLCNDCKWEESASSKCLC
jgi:hypothetical protein